MDTFQAVHTTLQNMKEAQRISKSIETFDLTLLDFLTTRGGSGTAATSKMEGFAIIVNGWKLLTIITKRPILDLP